MTNMTTCVSTSLEIDAAEAAVPLFSETGPILQTHLLPRLKTHAAGPINEDKKCGPNEELLGLL